eukprot:gene26-9293_t
MADMEKQPKYAESHVALKGIRKMMHAKGKAFMAAAKAK